jgi:hypothetical protein
MELEQRRLLNPGTLFRTTLMLLSDGEVAVQSVLVPDKNLVHQQHRRVAQPLANSILSPAKEHVMRRHQLFYRALTELLTST